MSNITLSIGGRSYTVACAEGEENHVRSLGSMINTKVSSMGDMSGQAETRMLLFAALLLADELHEANNQPRSSQSPAPADGEPSPEMAGMLAQLANRLENLAERLES
jgi:cell division protein ZapA